MYKLKNNTSEVIFSGDPMDSTPTLRGYTETTSNSEHNKCYYVRATIDPEDINVKFIDEPNYKILRNLFMFEGNSFSIESTDGDSFTNCYIKGGKLPLKRKLNMATGKYYYVGTLPIGCR